MIIYESFIADLKSKILDILIELKSQNLTIKQIVTFKVLNVLKSSFFIYLIVLIKSTRKKNKFSNLIELFQNLADEENRRKIESATVNLTRQKEAGNEPKREDNKKREKKNKCFRCDRSPHLKVSNQ